MERRICWPDPDATCLEGGCLYCDEHPFRSFAEIRRYVESVGMVPSGTGKKLALVAWHDGLANDFQLYPEVRNTQPEE